MAGTVRVRCPGCKALFEIAPGTVAECPQCRKRLRAPAKPSTQKPVAGSRHNRGLDPAGSTQRTVEQAPAPASDGPEPAEARPPSDSTTVEQETRAKPPRKPEKAAQTPSPAPTILLPESPANVPTLRPTPRPASAPATPAEVMTLRRTPARGRRPSGSADRPGEETMTVVAKSSSPGGEPSGGEPRVVGPYRVEKLLGRGGMGVVYKAVDTRLGRTVALKVLRSGGDAAPEELARFRLEAQNAAKLQHPHIVPIHDIGREADLDYFTMDYIEGGTLSAWLREEQPSCEEHVAMLEKIARAVHHAHEQGIIHRDLKPSNVMVDKQGEPHVMDFGLARNVESAQGLTVSGTALGTPQYMPPEQAKGAQKEIGPHSDVWALGVMLYEMLCGRAPFEGETVFQVLRAVVADDPVPPRKRAPGVSLDLDTICLKCLEKDWRRRYASAAELADDLRAFLTGEPITARPLSRMERAYRACRKRPVLGVSAVLLLAFAGVAAWLLQATSTTERVAKLKEAIEGSLTERIPTLEELGQLDRQCAELEALDPDAAALAKRKVNKSFADALTRLVRQPRPEEAELQTVESSLKLLQARDPELGSAVEGEHRQRQRNWETLFNLAPPFADLARVFDARTVKTDENGIYATRPRDSPAGPLCVTREEAAGNVRLDASFVRWQEMGRLGLGFKSAAGRGYAVIVCAQSEVTPPKGEMVPPEYAPTLGNAAEGRGTATLQVWRAGSKVLEQRLEPKQLADEHLRLRVQREGGKFILEVAGAPAVAFEDPFPLAMKDRGCFEVIIPGKVRLELLQAARQAQPAAPSPLERADELYEQGKYQEALTAYQEQGLQTATGAFGQEARYKQGLCLVGLGRREAAAALFDAVGAEDGKRWPLLALCQLMAILIEKKDLEQAWAIVDVAEMRFGGQRVALSIPENLKGLIRDAYIQEFSGVMLLGCTPERVAKLERAAKATRLIETSHWRNSWVRWNLMRAKHWLGDYEAAERLAREMMSQIPEEDGWHLLVAEERSWLLRLAGKAPAALQLVNGLLLDGKGRPRPERRLLLVERARILAAQEKWDEAEADLDLLYKIAPLKDLAYRQWAAGHLLRGFLAKRRGDEKTMAEAWNAAAVEPWYEATGQSQFPRGTMEKLLVVHAGALSGTLKQSHLDAILEAYGERGEDAKAGTTPSAAQSLLQVLAGSGGVRLMAEAFKMTPAAMNALWRQPRGLDVARTTAFLNVPLSQIAGGPLSLLLYGMVQQGVPRPLTDEEDRILWETSRRGFEEFRKGNFGITKVGQLGMAFRGQTGRLGWGGLTADLVPDIRGPMAYFLAFQFENLNKGDEAVKLWQLALKDAPADSALKKLAAQELEKRSRKEK